MGDKNIPFPAGLSVLVVDDDSLCLMILERMLKRCNYQVTTCQKATTAIAMLRENRDKFHLVLSDVHMPDMDGFKLLELIGLEMGLPVIMMSADGDTEVVMKGVTHGACDYLIKPVRLEELRNIWQHVVRKRRDSTRDHSGSADDSEKPKNCSDAQNQNLEEYTSSATEGNFGNRGKKRKEADFLEEEAAAARREDEASALKKSRVVWSVELHQQFVDAVNQLGIEKAVPKRILEIMKVQGLTRENIASHLQKYRLYLKRLSGVSQGQPVPTPPKDGTNFPLPRETSPIPSTQSSNPADLLQNASIQQLLLAGSQSALPARNLLANQNPSLSGLAGLTGSLGGLDPALLLNIANLQALQQQQAALNQQQNGTALANAGLGNPLLSAQAGILQGLPGGYQLEHIAEAQQQLAAMQGQQQLAALEKSAVPGANPGALSMQQRLALLQAGMATNNPRVGLPRGRETGIDNPLLTQLIQSQQQHLGSQIGRQSSLPSQAMTQRRASSNLGSRSGSPPPTGGAALSPGNAPFQYSGNLIGRRQQLGLDQSQDFPGALKQESSQPLPSHAMTQQRASSNLGTRSGSPPPTGGTALSPRNAPFPYSGNLIGRRQQLGLDENEEFSGALKQESAQPFQSALLDRVGRAQQSGSPAMQNEHNDEAVSTGREFNEFASRVGTPSLLGVGSNSGTFTSLLNLPDFEGVSLHRWGSMDGKMTADWPGFEASGHDRDGEPKEGGQGEGGNDCQEAPKGGAADPAGLRRETDVGKGPVDDPFSSFWD